MTVKGMSKMAYELLKDKHNIAKTTTSSSGDNVACQECKPSKSIKTPRTPRFFITSAWRSWRFWALSSASMTQIILQAASMNSAIAPAKNIVGQPLIATISANMRLAG